jgi:hypothetical protein
VPIGWRSIGTPLTLPCIVRWIVRSIKRSERRREHGSMRKHDVKEAYVGGGERALIKAKWPRLTQD